MEDLADLEPFLRRNGPTIVNNRILCDDSILHEGQKEALRIIIEDARPVSVVSMPTGTGKTSVISCLPYMFGWAAVENDMVFDFNKPILVIAPDSTSLNQLEQSLCYNLKNVSPFLTRLLHGDERRLLYQTDIIKKQRSIQNVGEVGVCDVVLFNEKYHGVTKLNNDHFSVVIVDEAHNLPYLKWREIIDHFRDHARVIFLTAGHKYDKEITDDDKHFPIIYSLLYKFAVEKKFIREVTHSVVDKLKLSSIIKSTLEEKNKNFPLPNGTKHAAHCHYLNH